MKRELERWIDAELRSGRLLFVQHGFSRGQYGALLPWFEVTSQEKPDMETCNGCGPLHSPSECPELGEAGA
jgi:hypothetical protein